MKLQAGKSVAHQLINKYAPRLLTSHTKWNLLIRNLRIRRTSPFQVQRLCRERRSWHSMTGRFMNTMPERALPTVSRCQRRTSRTHSLRHFRNGRYEMYGRNVPNMPTCHELAHKSLAFVLVSERRKPAESWFPVRGSAAHASERMLGNKRSVPRSEGARDVRRASSSSRSPTLPKPLISDHSRSRMNETHRAWMLMGGGVPYLRYRCICPSPAWERT